MNEKGLQIHRTLIYIILFNIHENIKAKNVPRVIPNYNENPLINPTFSLTNPSLT